MRWFPLSGRFVAVIVLASAPVAGWAQVEDEEAGLQDLAVSAYSARHRVGADEARRRLAIQDRAAGLEDELATLLGDQWAGMWYDAADGGRLKIGTTDAARAQANEMTRLVLQHGVASDADFVPVRFTEAELTATQDRLRAALGRLVESGHAKTGYNPALNGVVLTALDGLPESEEALVRRLSATPGVVLRRAGAAPLILNANACNITFCDPPLRGGREIISGVLCTASFMAQGKGNPDDRVLFTAGHCTFLGGPTWFARDESNAVRQIGDSAATLWGGAAGLDAGLVRNEANRPWFNPPPAAQVVVKSSSQTTYDPTYAIKSDAKSTIGQMLCLTGRTTGTHCAEVSDLGADEAEQAPGGGPIIVVHNMGELDACVAKQGDSGGPLYKSHKAYGLLSGVIASPPFHCYEAYQGIRAAEKAFNVEILVQP